MSTDTQNILDLFNQLPEIEKHEFASEIIRWTAKRDFPPLTDEALVQVADARFVELDKMEAGDAEPKLKRSPDGTSQLSRIKRNA